MKRSNNFRKGLVLFFKLCAYIGLYFGFLIIFQPRYSGLLIFSRTSVIITLTFFFTTMVMTSFYGKLDIGERKSKPLFYGMALNILITDIITFIALRIMGYHDGMHFLVDIGCLMIAYFIQLLFIKIIIEIGNTLYFKNYIPEKTIIIHNHSIHLDKIKRYILRHGKQYELVDVFDKPKVNSLRYEEYERIFMLDMDYDFVNEVLNRCYLLDINIMINSSLYNVLIGSKSKTILDDLLFTEFTSRKMTDFQRLLKRIFDILLSSIALVVVSPLMLLVALGIKLDDGGPVFFTQTRLTINGRTFKIYKFRSMKLGSGSDPAQVDDNRITKVGNIIRKLRVDELPQLINIVKGDMSLVGPRPETAIRCEEILKEVPEFNYRLKVKAGLTGYAQINGKYNTDPLSKLLLDLEYIENFSLYNDIKLMFQTLIVFLKKDSTEGFDKTER